MSNDDRNDRMIPPESSPTPGFDVAPTEAFTSPGNRAPVEPAPTEAIRLAQGSLVDGRYHIREVLGVGGMGIVYRAYDQTLELEVALKVLRPEVAHDPEFLQRFRHELIVARRVTHRNVIRIHDIGEHEGMYYMSMDLVEGRSLQEVLKEEGKLDLEEASAIVRQIAEALDEAHRQAVVHRDLKPANILIDAEGRAYVSDFGVARSLQTPGFTQTGTVLGTPDYLSPEQARGEKVDGRSDLYTLGIMYVEMLSGKLPFPRGTLLEVLAQRMTGKTQSLEELGVQTPPAFNAVIDRCLAKDPSERYQTAADLLADLDDMRRPERRRRRRLLLRALGAAAAAALLVLAGLAFRQWLTTRPPPPSAVQSSPAAAAPLEPLHSVAVLPFPNESGREDLAWASTGIAEMLASALGESQSLRVVDSVRVIQMLDDLGFQPSRLSEAEFRQLAEIFQVDRLVVGRLRSSGEQVRIEARLVEADQPDAAPRPIDTLSGTADDLFRLVGELGATLREDLKVAPVADATTSLTPSSRAMQAYVEGLQQLSRGDPAQAAGALEQAVADDPSFAAAWLRLAKIYQELGRHDDALRAAREAVRQTGTAGGRAGFEARAQEALLQGRSEEAQSFLEELVERYPNDAKARVALAEAYGKQGNFGEAIARLQEAVRVDPSDPRSWFLLGRYAIQSGDSRRAVDDYLVRALVQHKRLQNEHGQAEVLNALGIGYRLLGQLDQAVENHQAAAEIRRRIGDRAGLAQALQNLGVVHLARGDPDSAEENVRAALEIHTELGNRAGIGELNTAYGFVEEVRGRYSEALTHFRRALQVRSELGDERALAESHNNVGYSYFLLGEYDNAGLYLERSLALYEKHGNQSGAIGPLQSLGFCQLAQGSWPRASQSFLRALELSRDTGLKPNEAVSHGNLGVVAQYQGRYPAALKSYQAAIEIFEELGDPRGRIEFTLHEGEARLELGDLEGVSELLERVEGWQADGGNQEQRADLFGLRGRWHLARGELQESGTALAEALREAEASRSAAAFLRARVRAGRQKMAAGDVEGARGLLRPAFSDAEKLGHAVLQLRAGEALAEALTAAGDLDSAEEILRQTLRVSNETGSYARAFRLHHLMAELSSRQEAEEAATRELREAAVQLERIREQLDDELRQSFDELPEVRELVAAGAAL